MTLSAIADMEAALAEMTRAAEARIYNDWEVAHRQFHQVLTVETDSRTTDTLSHLADHADRYRRIYAEHAPLYWSLGIRQHEQMLETVRRFEPDAVARLVAKHIGRAGQMFVDLARPGYRSLRIEDAMALVLGAEDQQPRAATEG